MIMVIAVGMFVLGSRQQFRRRCDIVFDRPGQTLFCREAATAAETFLGRHTSARPILAGKGRALILRQLRWHALHKGQAGIDDEEAQQPDDHREAARETPQATGQATAVHRTTLR
jgi:hypothetical protein